ncbi:B12-binding domain-containing radical SAM protein [Nocardia sp. NPDC051570]|uniref:B12-binding domain-containing radical SAM protein n=1 Tax=Nocardia sp. NPDC051570 TaxID=3364324 RepID=UPI0037A27F1B
MHTDSPLAHRLLTVVTETGGDTDKARALLADLHASEPNPLREGLARVLPGRVLLTGTLDHRLILTEHPDHHAWTIADLAGQPLAQRNWPDWVREGVEFHTPRSWLSTAVLAPAAEFRFTRPRTLLTALYHPENFPLPRFPLAISDLARAARATLTGQVALTDMQLGVTLGDILTTIGTDVPDILGVSATFGQHDLLVALLEAIEPMPDRPLVIAGGSLTARNEHLLLERWPWLLLARGAGEPTLADAVAFWHKDLRLQEIRGLGYTGAARGEGTLSIGRYRRTATVPNRTRTDIFPELDLLAATFDRHGVAQLESSRGCTNFCSFCPRGHKGTWSGVPAHELPGVVTAMSEVFDRYPHIPRTLYLVDEEFIGRGPDAVARAVAVADTLHQRGFSWETSCRIDQVVRLDADREWHLDRARMWRRLCEHGLRRCLFGVESGVTSVLTRFNKETTADQNALAIRTLSALGVPTRYTYITFDHLMTAAELHATRDFQARTDLILRPLPDLPVAEIVDGVRDESFVAAHSVGRAFYSAISYMLVSMECLIGAAYTKQVQAAGLAGPARPSMGRLDADYADPRIGVLSEHAQLWVDRNFALDYTLKSLEKILDGPPYRDVRAARVVLKDSAFALLDDMLALLDRTPAASADLPDAVTALMDVRLGELRTRMSGTIAQLRKVLAPADRDLLTTEWTRWHTRTEWTLINAADPCGT